MTDKIFFIAGVQHHKMKDVINEIAKINKDVSDLGHTLELDLSPEPSNKFDPNAIQILFGVVMLGYVPKKISSEVSAAIETYGDKVICTILAIDKSAKPWEQCKVSIHVESELDTEIF